LNNTIPQSGNILGKNGIFWNFLGIFTKIYDMRTTLFVIVSFLALSSVAQIKKAAKGVNYGSKITAANAVEVNILEEKLVNNPAFTGKVKGTVVSVCQEEGCWMKLEQTEGDGIMIRFKDNKFFVPKNISGKEVVLDGVAKITTTSVEMLKHYAEDAGKSKEEIAKITEPKKEIEFTASGVLVLN
jgi:hypothetical protein